MSGEWGADILKRLRRLQRSDDGSSSSSLPHKIKPASTVSPSLQPEAERAAQQPGGTGPSATLSKAPTYPRLRRTKKNRCLHEAYISSSPSRLRREVWRLFARQGGAKPRPAATHLRLRRAEKNGRLHEAYVPSSPTRLMKEASFLFAPQYGAKPPPTAYRRLRRARKDGRLHEADISSSPTRLMREAGWLFAPQQEGPKPGPAAAYRRLRLPTAPPTEEKSLPS